MGDSGSAMTAGWLALQCHWTGTCTPADSYNPRGYFENLRVNGALGRLYRGAPYADLRPMHAVRRWPGYVAAVQAAEGYRGGPWLAKVNAFTWPVWLPPDPVFVYCCRDVRSVASSSMRRRPAGVRRFLRPRTPQTHRAPCRGSGGQSVRNLE